MTKFLVINIWIMIQEISFETVLPIWQTELWPYRQSRIEPSSAMLFNSDKFDIGNFSLPKWFLGYYVDNKLIGVNSGHMCTDGTSRSRGLWVNCEYRNHGYGKLLLSQTIELARQHTASAIWSYPRKTSWNTYKSVGFTLMSPWEESETSSSNAYCYMRLN